MNTATMTPDIFWLALTGLLTAVLWAPHVLHLIFVQEGIVGAFMDKQGENLMKPVWAQRAKRAHINAQLNFAVLAPLVLMAHFVGVDTAWLGKLVMVYFIARLGHYLVYTAGLPLLRQLLFVISATIQAVIAVNILQAF